MQKHKWTLNEDDYLKWHWEEKSIKELSNKLGRSNKSVLNRLNYLGLVKESRTNISDEEMELLKDPNKSNVDIAIQLKLSSETIRRHRRRFCPDIKINKHYKWTKEDDNYLKENFADNTNEQLAKKLGRTTTAIKIRGAKLKLSKSAEFLSENKKIKFSDKDLKLLADEKISSYKLAKMLYCSDLTVQKYRKELFPDKYFTILRKNSNKWNKKDDLFLRQNYTKISAKDLANKLNRSVSSIKNRIHLIKKQENGE